MAAVDGKLRQEKALLWRARNLHQQFVGDATWIPCGLVETPEDRYIFEPKAAENLPDLSNGQQNSNFAGSSSINGHTVAQPDGSIAKDLHAQTEAQLQADTDVDMNTEAPSEQTNNDTHDQHKVLKSEEADAGVNDLPPHPKSADESNHTVGDAGVGDNEIDTRKDGENVNHDAENRANHEEDLAHDAEMQDGSSPEPPRRMTTRAQANASNPQDDDMQSLAFSADSASSLLTPHPLFLIPDSVRPDANFGLPPNEAEETRRLLWSYVQKQEETVRGFEHMLDSLFRACHMKSDVMEWCKAEGHVGEMSDGEDWYDREKWGLAEGEDLKKGTDDEEGEVVVDDSRTTAKRGRRRA